jgi:hypothetical protein
VKGRNYDYSSGGGSHCGELSEMIRILAANIVMIVGKWAPRERTRNIPVRHVCSTVITKRVQLRQSLI